MELLLKDRTGSAIFFRKEVADSMEYPRLQMAIHNDQRAFVGHMFCQQILRSQWHGKVPWHGKTVLFRLLYVLLQIMLTVPFILHHVSKMFMR